MDYEEICEKLITANNKTTHHIAEKAMVKFGEYKPSKLDNKGIKTWPK